MFGIKSAVKIQKFYHGDFVFFELRDLSLKIKRCVCTDLN